jgi:hypothetical protein
MPMKACKSSRDVPEFHNALHRGEPNLLLSLRSDTSEHVWASDYRIWTSLDGCPFSILERVHRDNSGSDYYPVMAFVDRILIELAQNTKQLAVWADRDI